MPGFPDAFLVTRFISRLGFRLLAIFLALPKDSLKFRYSRKWFWFVLSIVKKLQLLNESLFMISTSLPSRPRLERSFFAAFRVTFLMPGFLSNQSRVRLKCTAWGYSFCVASWLFRTTWYLFTTCLKNLPEEFESLPGFLRLKIQLRVCPDHILSSADKQRRSWQFYDRQKPRYCEWTSRNTMTPHKKNALTWRISMYHVIGLKQTRGIKDVTLKTARKFMCVLVYWEK